MRSRLAIVAAILAGAVVATSPLAAQSGQYQKLTEIHLGGPMAGFDYLSVDATGRRVYVSNYGSINGQRAGQLFVIDMDKNTVVGKIEDTPGVHAIVFTPAGKGFSSNGAENKASIVDLKTLKTESKVDIGPGPDAILYEPKNNEVYAFNHQAGTATVIKGDTGAMVTTIKLSGGSIETGVADPGLGRVFVNIEETSNIDAIDIATHKVVATWPVAPASGPTGLAIDTTTHRLFSGGGPNTVMIDAKTGKVVASIAICGNTDATVFDPGTKYVMSSCSDGHITIAKEDGDKLTLVQTLTTIPRARTMAVDPKTHNIYVVGSDVAAPAGGGRPTTVPESFKAVVYGMK